MSWETMDDNLTIGSGAFVGTYNDAPALYDASGNVLARWDSVVDEWQRWVRKPSPKPESLYYVEMEYQYNSDTWINWRLGPVTKSMAVELERFYRGSSYHRNIRIVPAASEPQSDGMWGVTWDWKTPERTMWWFKDEHKARKKFAECARDPENYPNLRLLPPRPAKTPRTWWVCNNDRTQWAYSKRNICDSARGSAVEWDRSHPALGFICDVEPPA